MSCDRQGQLQLTVEGMRCADEAAQVERVLKQLNGVLEVRASVAAGTVTIIYDPSVRDVASLDSSVLRKAVEGVGRSVANSAQGLPAGQSTSYALADFPRHVLTLFGIVFGAVLFVVVIGEWIGLFVTVTARVPWPLGLAIVLGAGYPVFRKVVQAAFEGRITSHTLMTVGTLAALAVGEWATAVVVVFFMRVGDYAERFTTARARRAVKDLTAMAPQMARVERGGTEQEVPVGEVQGDETVIVRPGEKIPVDGEVLSGQATVDQATITGESMPVEVGPGASVFAATIARLGSLRIRATHVGPETIFGRVIHLVEAAEAHRAEVQRLADRFSGSYLPVVGGIAALTFVLRHDPLAAAAVLVVACSCAFALATPMAMLASIGAGARRGLLSKGASTLSC